MNEQDLILRSYAILGSLKQNIPEGHEVEGRWVQEYGKEIENLEKSLYVDLSGFKVPHDALHRSPAVKSQLWGKHIYREGLWCERSVLMHKLDAVLLYFSAKQPPEDRKIGFKPP